MVTTFFGTPTTAETIDNGLTGCTSGVVVGYSVDDTSNVKLTGNTFTGNDVALTFTGPGATGYANRNAFVNNGEGIVGVDFVPSFDATCNWWNDPFGPSDDGPGVGDSVSGAVTFEPWLLTDDLAGVCSGGGTPRSLKEQALAFLLSLDLENIFTSMTKGAKDIEKAMDSIEKSLNPILWTDDSTLNVVNGETVFKEERNAVVELSKPYISNVIDALVMADKIIAEKAIATAGADGANPADIVKANQFMAKAAKATADGDPKKAINYYRQAWMMATKYMRQSKSKNSRKSQKGKRYLLERGGSHHLRF
jgi:hypothetical protein